MTGRRNKDLACLTPRELEVARLLAQGMTNRAIAEQLVITERTAETHVANACAKRALTGRLALALYALELES